MSRVIRPLVYRLGVAGLLLLDPAVVFGAPPPTSASGGQDRTTAGVESINPEARRHFNAGVALLQDPEGERVEAAYREFKVAYELSGSPKILGNMGFCAMRLERDGEAIHAYSRYLREVANIDPEERAQIVADLQTLSVGLVRVTVQVNLPGAHLLDTRVPVRGEAITNTYGPVDRAIELGLRPGHHTLVVTLPGYNSVSWEFEAFAGAREHHTFELKANSQSMAGQLVSDPGQPRKVPLFPWLVTGFGAASMGAGAVTGIMMLGKVQEIKNMCPNDNCPPPPVYDLDSARSKARTLAGVTDVLLFGGAAVTVTGVVWLLLSADSGPSPMDSRTENKTAWQLGCGPLGCFAGMKGSF